MFLIRIIAARSTAARTVTSHWLTEPFLAYALDFSELSMGEETTRIKFIIDLIRVDPARLPAAFGFSVLPVYKNTAFG